MRRRAGVLGLVVAVLLALWWWRGSRETSTPQEASKGAVAVGSSHAKELAKTATLSGRVTRAKDGAPIANAYVAISLADDPNNREVPPSIVATAADGRWTKPIVPGSYNIGVVADGFLPARKGPLDVVARTATEADIALDQGGVVLRGSVTDIGGGPIDGARVATTAANTYIATFTRPDGSYRLTLDPAFHAIEYTHDDYMPASVDLSLSTQDALHNESLVPAGTIRGIVFARDTGKPIANAVVTAPGSRAQVSGEAETDADGKFVLRGVGAGDVSLYANASGYVTTQPTIVNLGIGDSVEARVSVERGYMLRGHVRRSGHPNEGVAGVIVGAHTDAAVPDARSRVATASDGAFEIGGLAPARYTLTATGHDIIETTVRDVVLTRDVDDLEIEVSSGITLRGRIDPPETVALSIYSTDGYESAFRSAHITEDASGAFIATNVAPGKASISASSPKSNGTLSVQVGTVDQSGLVVALQQHHFHTVSGTVVDGANTPVARGWVDASGESAFANDDGTFALHATGPTQLFASFGVGDYPRSREPIMKLDVDRDITGLVLKIPATRGEIKGRVIGTDGKPAADVWVSAQASPVLTGADGSFTITALRTGDYDVHAETARGDANATIHKVATGSTIEIALHGAATLHGRVTLAGAPVPHFEVRCEGADYFERRIDSPDGTFSFERVLAREERTVQCRAATEQAEGQANVVFAPGSAQVAIELIPFAMVTGTVLDVFTKQPISDAHVAIAGRPLGALFTTNTQVSVNGRFALDHVPVEDVRIFISTKQGFAVTGAHPIAGQTIDVGTIYMLPTPRDPASFEMYVDSKMTIRIVNEDRYPQLHRGDTIAAIDGIPVSAMPPDRWEALFVGNAERGHAYALTLARGVTVNITAE